MRLKKADVMSLNDQLAKENIQLKAVLSETQERLKRAASSFDSSHEDLINANG